MTTIKTTDTNRIYNIYYRFFDGDNWSEDLALVIVPISGDYQREKGGNAYLMTQVEFDSLCDFFNEICEENNGALNLDEDAFYLFDLFI